MREAALDLCATFVPFRATVDVSRTRLRGITDGQVGFERVRVDVEDRPDSDAEYSVDIRIVCTRAN